MSAGMFLTYRVHGPSDTAMSAQHEKVDFFFVSQREAIQTGIGGFDIHTELVEIIYDIGGEKNAKLGQRV